MSTLVSRNVEELPDPAAEARLRATQRICQIMEQAQSHADRQGISDAEIDAAIEDAMSAIRRRD